MSISTKCYSCKKCCRKNQNHIQCDICTNWLHFSCTVLTARQLEQLALTDAPFYCSICINCLLPFQSLDNANIKEIYSNNSHNQIIKNLKLMKHDAMGTYCDMNEFSNFNNKCCYYNMDELYNLLANKGDNDLLSMHVNIRSHAS